MVIGSRPTPGDSSGPSTRGPRPEDFDLHDIAHALSQICRFGGHTLRYYSAAQHSTMVGHLSASLVGHMHDATEAYLGDMVRPLKYSMSEYLAVEDRMWNVICDAFDFPGVARVRVSEAVELPNRHAQMMPAIVKTCDNLALVTERRDMVAPAPAKWAPELEALTPLPEKLIPHCPVVAEKEFLAQFWRLHELGI